MENNVKKRGGGTRISYIDSLKGFSILLVVLGHVAAGYTADNTYPDGNQIIWWIYNFIYAFHMPLFMMISGYVYYASYFEREGKAERTRIFRQIGNSVVVYIIFSICFGIGKVLFSSAVVDKVSISDLFLIWGRPIGLYWYLYVLIEFYFIFMIPVFNKANYRIMSGALLAVSLLSHLIHIQWFELSRILYYAFFFYLGFSNRKYKDWVSDKKSIVFTAFAASIILTFIFWDSRQYTTKNDMHGLNSIPFANVFIALGLSLILWYSFEHVKFLRKNRFFQFLGENSLEIYLIHSILIAGFRAIFPRIGVSNPYISLVLNFVMSTLIPLSISLITKKMKIHDLIFKPVSWFSKFNKT